MDIGYNGIKLRSLNEPVKALSGIAKGTMIALVLGVGVFAVDWAEAQQRPQDGKQGKQEEKVVVKTPVDTLLKNLNSVSTRQKALEELAQRLAGDEADADILMRADDFVKSLLPVMKNGFDKTASGLAADALAGFGKSDPAVVDLFVAEIQKGTAAARLSAVRGVGKVGAPAKEKAEPSLTAILKDPRTKTGNPALYNEALMARALLGGPFEAEIVPEMLRIAAFMKDPFAQADMVIAIAKDKELLKLHAKQLEPLAIKSYQTISVQMFNEKRIQALVETLVSLKTPNAEKIIYDIMAGTDKGIQPWGFRKPISGFIKETYDVPSPQILKALLVGFEKEGSPWILRDIGAVLMGYGGSAKSVLPELREYLKSVPTRGYDGGAKSRPDVAAYTQGLINQIEKAAPAEKKDSEPGK
jgi:hypothetical protein